MAYSTGTGNLAAMMSAVLAHAIADGWDTTGGDWPISKGNVRGVAWGSGTFTANDFTVGGSVSRTFRRFHIGIGTSRANAASNVSSDVSADTSIFSARMAINDEATFTWYIFSDPGVGKPDYIHVACVTQNFLNVDILRHFSFGEIDRQGMTHGPIFYASVRNSLHFVSTTSSAASNQSSACSYRATEIFSGRINDTNEVPGTSIVWMMSGTNRITPTGGLWPIEDVVYDGSRLLSNKLVGDTVASSTYGSIGIGLNYASPRLCGLFAVHKNPPFSGGVTMMTPYFIISTENSSSAELIYGGIFPDAKFCNVEIYGIGDEVSFAGDIWKLFPLLRKTDNSILGNGTQVTSGWGGIAFKKVE